MFRRILTVSGVIGFITSLAYVVNVCFYWWLHEPNFTPQQLEVLLQMYGRGVLLLLASESLLFILSTIAFFEEKTASAKRLTTTFDRLRERDVFMLEGDDKSVLQKQPTGEVWYVELKNDAWERIRPGDVLSVEPTRRVIFHSF